jgi:hypothetical protein
MRKEIRVQKRKRWHCFDDMIHTAHDPYTHQVEVPPPLDPLDKTAKSSSGREIDLSREHSATATSLHVQPLRLYRAKNLPRAGQRKFNHQNKPYHV